MGTKDHRTQRGSTLALGATDEECCRRILLAFEESSSAFDNQRGDVRTGQLAPYTGGYHSPNTENTE